MSNARVRRVAGQIKKEISHIMMSEIKDPRVSPAVTSITDVKVSRDFSHAWVYISVFDENKDNKDKTIAALKNASGYFRTEIGRRVRLRHIPEIHFLFDESIEYGAHINKVLKDIMPAGENEGEDGDEDGDGDEKKQE